MTKYARRACLFLLLAAVLVATACASSGQVAPATSTESETHDEGVDTPCEVSFAANTGSHKDLFLSQGDTIAIVSPSTMPTQEQVDDAVNGLRSWGYEVVTSKHVCDEQRTLQDCVDDLRWALEDPNVKAIFCIRGGYGASEVLDAFGTELTDLIVSSNKLVVGYSDVTVLHAAWTTAGVPSVHACMNKTFTELTEASKEAERRVLAGEVPTYTCKTNEYCKQGEVEGTLIGGNLATFISTVNAAYDCTKTSEPYILFLEDVGENYRYINRYLTVLKHAGVLDKAAGIVFGEWVGLPVEGAAYNGDSRGGEFKSMADMISRQFLGNTNVPVAFGFPAGHGDVHYPLLMGETAHLSVGEDSFTLSWPTDVQ